MVSNIFYFHPYLGKIPILTNIFQMGWNHQPVMDIQFLPYQLLQDFFHQPYHFDKRLQLLQWIKMLDDVLLSPQWVVEQKSFVTIPKKENFTTTPPPKEMVGVRIYIYEYISFSMSCLSCHRHCNPKRHVKTSCFCWANNPWTEVLPSYQRLNEEDRAQLSESLGTFDR